MNRAIALLLIINCSSAALWAAGAETPSKVTPFSTGANGRTVFIWGKGAYPRRAYFDEFLPALFERTLVFEKYSLPGEKLEWIFTGDRGAFNIALDESAATLIERFYDSIQFGRKQVQDIDGTAWRHPEWRGEPQVAKVAGPLKTLAVRVDHAMNFIVAVNGKEVFRTFCPFDLARHQLRVTGPKGEVRGKLLEPSPQACDVRVTGKRRQTMIGFGGITIPPAYAELSPEGKRVWWQKLVEYNLLIQREYPMGTQLHRQMDNFDNLADASPQYYADNFPNGEVSDFRYLKAIRKLGGQVWFEFWDIPPWARKGDRQESPGKFHYGAADPTLFAEAVVRYCRLCAQRTGAAPEIVGIKNEDPEPTEVFHQMTLVLRRELDRAGFQAVRIHMPDPPELGVGFQRIADLQKSAEAWRTIDYAAGHPYDFQNHFRNPDKYDAILRRWRELIGEKPFLSNEVSVLDLVCQSPAYRVALSMGQLWHKNLVIADAVALCYCWTLLTVEQPSYGWTRSLFVPDRTHGFVPKASSAQLRVYGAYSRRIHRGMTRLDAETACPDVLASAWQGPADVRTVVLLNRGTVPRQVRLSWAESRFSVMERVDPYSENAVVPCPSPSADGTLQVLIDPGALVTLSNVPLLKLPADFSFD